MCRPDEGEPDPCSTMVQLIHSLMIVVGGLTRAAVAVEMCTEGGEVLLAVVGSEIEVLLAGAGREILGTGAARQRKAAPRKKRKNAKKCIVTVMQVSR